MFHFISHGLFLPAWLVQLAHGLGKAPPLAADLKEPLDRNLARNTPPAVAAAAGGVAAVPVGGGAADGRRRLDGPAAARP